MSVLTYLSSHDFGRQAAGLAPWRGEIPTRLSCGPLEAGVLLRRLQQGEKLGLPHARPMPGIGPRCHELRIPDAGMTWRIIYRIDPDALVIADVFAKKTQATPQHIITTCHQRLRQYDAASAEED